MRLYKMPALLIFSALSFGGCASLQQGASAPVTKNVSTLADPSYSATLKTLRMDTKVIRAMAQIEGDRNFNNSLMVELNEIPAPPFGEEKRAARFVEVLKAEGITDIHIDEAGNVIARRPGTVGARTLAIAAHIDTVFPIETDVSVKIDGNTYTAPGIGDNTRGMVVMVSLLRALEVADIQTRDDTLFVGTTGEEGLGDLRGVKALFAEGGPDIDAFIAIDGGQINRLIHSAVGSHRYRVTVSGSGGHSWGDFGFANPHHALGRAIELFASRAPEVSASGPKTSFSVGRIGGGTSINSIPFESWMEVDMRSEVQDKLDDMDAVFQQSMIDGLAAENAARKKGGEISLKVDRVGKRPAGIGDPTTPLVQQTMAAMKSLGITPTLRASSTDSNIPISLGIPAVTLSRGGISKGAHGLSESWTDKDSHIGVQLSLLTLLQNAGYEAANNK